MREALSCSFNSERHSRASERGTSNKYRLSRFSFGYFPDSGETARDKKKTMKKGILFLLPIASLASAIEPDWALYGVSGSEFNDGLSEYYSTETNLHGYVDANGNIAIPATFKRAEAFARATAIVSDSENKEGVIDTKGNYTLPPGDYDIYGFDEMPGYYKIVRNSDDKAAFFDGRNFLTGFDYNYIGFYGNYPFLSLSSRDKENGKKGVMNVLTGEYYPNHSAFPFGGIGVIVTSDTPDFKLFSFEGEPLDPSSFMISSKGNELFRGSNGRWGIRNAKTQKIVISSKYILDDIGRFRTMWVNDVVELFDSISPELRRVSVLVNQDGREIIRSTNPELTYTLDKLFISVRNIKKFTDDSLIRYYDFTGRSIPELDGAQWSEVYSGIYTNFNDKVYFGSTKSFMNNVKHPSFSDGFMIYRNPLDEKLYVYSINNKKQYGPFDTVGEGFNEGILVVTENDKKCLLDRNGNSYYYPEGIEILGERFSEGVISAYDEPNHVYGFLYNPTGHPGWTYNQKNGDISDYAFNNLWEKANSLFDEKKYAQSMDVFAQLMMLRPQVSGAFNNYAACLYNLEYYDEALTAIELSLSQWPNNDYALNLKAKTIDAIEREKNIDAQDDYEEDSNSSTSVWDILGGFANALMQVSGQYSSGYYTPQYSLAGNAGGSGNVTDGNYESQYRNWERRAESHYNSLTNTGYSVTSKTGRKRGSAGQGMSSGNYVQMKRSLREAQREMRNIRNKAARAGVQIQKSRWEDATVGY